MALKSKNYEMFKLRPDNRLKIDKNHIDRIAASMNVKNMMEIRPIIVNQSMEIIDGQHRFLAAKKIGAEVHYKVDEKLESKDIISLNLSKPWGMNDYLNFYCKNGEKEYIEFNECLQKYGVQLNVGINLCFGKSRQKFFEFKMGRFTFERRLFSDKINICLKTISIIKKLTGFSSFTKSSRFWAALLQLVNHPSFDDVRWLAQCERMVSHFGPKATRDDYLDNFSHIYNYQLKDKLDFQEGLEKTVS